MPILKAGFAAAAVIIGAIGALFGLVLLVSALKSGTVQISYGTGADLKTDIFERATNAASYWRTVAALGIAPLVVGVLAARWGWRTIKGGGNQ